jgi:16S rRNA (adenine1518-N6/adenine1519-N6)-dimethyltransferase
VSAVADPRALLLRYGLRAKKSWGQNFLVSDRVYAAIVGAAATADDDWVVEIGAGLGTLTARLADRVPAGRVIAIERDRDLAAVLRAELGARANLEICEADAKRFDYRAVAARRGQPVAVCGNLPYQLSSMILFGLLAQRASVSRAVVMLQKEVAERLLAAPDSRAYSALTAIIGAFANVELVARAGPGAFHPPPKVESAVVRLRFVDRGLAIADEQHYAEVVHAAFRQRRKMVRNALRARFDAAAVDAALAALGIDGQRRGETLSIAELAGLAASIPGHA